MTKLNEILVVDCGSDLHVYVGTFPYTHTVFAKTIDFKRIYTEETFPDEIKVAIGMINATKPNTKNDACPYGYILREKSINGGTRYMVNISDELLAQMTGENDEYTRSQSENKC